MQARTLFHDHIHAEPPLGTEDGLKPTEASVSTGTPSLHCAARTGLKQGDATSDELVFQIKLDALGGFLIECLREYVAEQSVFSEQLRKNRREANALYIGHPKPGVGHLELARDDLVARAAA